MMINVAFKIITIMGHGERRRRLREYEYLKGWIRESREKIKLLRITITVA
jgi:hypothetical protein